MNNFMCLLDYLTGLKSAQVASKIIFWGMFVWMFSEEIGIWVSTLSKDQPF
jgi:hypothetical protein